jgi:malate dehydrogenase
VPDVSQAYVIDEGGIFGAGATAPVTALIHDKAFLANDLMTLVRRRGKAIVRARRVTPAMSAARAISDHLRDLWFGSQPGEWSSMGVMSDGNPYGVRAGIFFSFPVRIEAGGEWSFVGGLDIDEELRDKLMVRRRDCTFVLALVFCIR